MGWSSVCKVLQKQTHDFLNQRHGTLVLTLGTILIIVSAFQFGEVALEWSTEKYAAVFNSFSDNIAGRSYRSRLCLPVPIDVVYTWVNGSDQKLITELRRHKMLMEEQLNETSTVNRSDHCSFSHCVATLSVVLEPRIPPQLSLGYLGLLYPAFTTATAAVAMTNPARGNSNVTMVTFDTTEQVEAALNTTVYVEGKNVSIRQAYYTTDWTLPNAVVLHDTVMMTGFPHSKDRQALLETLPSKYQKSVKKFSLHEEAGVAVIVLSSSEDGEALLKETNITIEGKTPTLTSANLVWDLKDYSLSEDVSASRFEDNEELRYSLRSVERYAPWVRHVFIVTNGQIPGWMNMDSPRLTLVTHQSLFPNTSHLPTFSSPAIESHLHRIPGLSDKFIYLNDDVMFGKEVWPDDFYTHSRGQKVYLTWPVPNCQEGCPSSWIRDGYCDKACNNSECEWDGGDCKGGAAASNQVFGQGAGGWQGDIGAPENMYCNTGCANSWLADRYCDNACNVYSCGFDAGDCGTVSYKRLKGEPLLRDVTDYTIPRGETIYYLNLTSLLGENGTVQEADYTDTETVRTMAVASKFKVVTILVHNNRSEERIGVHLKGADDHGATFNLNISVTSNTLFKPPEDVPEKLNTTANVTQTKEVFLFEDVPEDIRSPRAAPVRLDPEALSVDVNMSLYELPANIAQEWTGLVHALEQGDLTEKGFRVKRGVMWSHFVDSLKAEGKVPVLKNLSTEENGENQPAKDEPVQHAKKSLDALGAPGQDQPMKEYLQNVSSKIKENKAEGVLIQAVENVQQNGNQAANVMDQNEQPQEKNPQQEGNLKFEGDPPQEGNPDSHFNRKLNSLAGGRLDEAEMNPGFLPWEKQGVFKDLQKRRDAKIVADSYQVAPVSGRRLLDTFGDSLRHVNKLYNQAFGYVARKVPAHMPHMIDKNIMGELQAKFPEEWDVTSSHKVRASDDMQFAFSYYYYLMGQPGILTVRDVFEELDIDNSGILSDRELRTMATRVFESPLDLQSLQSLEDKLKNCSSHAPFNPISRLYKQEKYYENDMPQVTRHLIEHCPAVIQLFERSYKQRNKYQHEVVGEEEVAFKMIRTNVSQVVGQLDDIRRHPKKFICLNDNIDHSKDEAKTVKAVLVDFYESMYPTVSSFELPREYRNRFLHLDELYEWRKYRDWLKLWTQVALVFLILFTVVSFFSDKIEALQRRYFGRRRAPSDDTPPPPRGAVSVV